jgi:hypothetical protein
MTSTQRALQLQKEGRLNLSKQALQLKQISSCSKAAVLFNVPRSTLHDRVHGALPQATANLKKRKLDTLEEQALVEWILDLNQRGFPPQIIDVRRMADNLLAARGQQPPPQPVGYKWASRFVNRQPELQTKWNRKLNSQRARCQDPAIINAWFKLVQETRLTYGVLDQDTYNFDETGFIIGVAATSKVVTSSNTVGRAVTVQPGDRKWVTTIKGVSASGWAIPPFIILSGKLHQASWYQGLPADWVVAVSDNGWTTDELGLKWLEHFNRHTISCTAGAYRLLILDGHSSHATPEFDQYCKNNKIITLCMPPHSSHLLQPLDVGCFSPLKHAYGREVQELARQGVFHVDKQDFLQTYQSIRGTVFTQQNIQAGFQAAGLVPACPERVLSSLTVVRTPSPPATAADPESAWTAETPRTVNQLQKQARLVQDLLRRSSQSPTTQAIGQLIKGCQLAMTSATILAVENRKLRQASQRRQRKQQQRRQYIASGGALQAQEGQLLAAEAERVAQDAEQAGQPGRQRAPPTCSKCHVQGHKRTQCTTR